MSRYEYIRGIMLEFYEPSFADKHLFPTTSRYLAYQYYFSYSVLWKEAVGLTICKTDTALYMHLDEDDCFLLPITDDLGAAMAELEAHCAESGQRLQLECVPPAEAKELQEMGYVIEHT